MGVDIASGTMSLSRHDVEIPGRVPLLWDRRYATSLLTRPPSPLGQGWFCGYFSTLLRTDTGFSLVTADGATQEPACGSRSTSSCTRRASPSS